MNDKIKDAITQVGLATFGISGLVMGYSTDPTAIKWAPVVGLMGQPFWIYMAIRGKLWGVGIMALAYGGAWSLGVYKMFFA